MYSSLPSRGSERKVYVFADFASAHAANCRVERDWLIHESECEADNGDVVNCPDPRRPIDRKKPTRFVLVENVLKDGATHVSEIPVFHLTETRPSPRTKPRTICMVKLYKLYSSDFHRHIHFDMNWSKEGEPWEWFTVYHEPSAVPNLENVEEKHHGLLRRSAKKPFGFPEFKDHVEGREIYGDFASEKTGHVKFDIDFHEPIWDFTPCLDVVRVVWGNLPALMKKLNGYGLHAQLKFQGVDGIHFLFFLHKKLDQAVVEKAVREFGLDLEGRYSELLLARRQCCNIQSKRESNSIHFIDKIGPNNHNGFRLPFCRDRQMIADSPISVEHGKKHDIVRFVAWQEECLRQNWTVQNSMPVDVLIDLGRRRFKKVVVKETFSPAAQAAKESGLPATQLDLSATQARPEENEVDAVSSNIEEEEKEEEWVYSSICLVSEIPAASLEHTHGTTGPKREDKLVWKGNAKRIIVETFTGQLIVPKSLDEISCFLARMAGQFTESSEEAVERFAEMLRLIPLDNAAQLSSRLGDGDYQAVEDAFQSKLDRISKGKLRIGDAEASEKLLGQCADWWKRVGFNPFLPKTWNKGHPLHRTQIRADIWTADDKMDFCDAILPLLGPSSKWVDPVHLVNVCLYWVRRKEREENGMAIGYWKIMLEGELNIPCGDNTERRHLKIKNVLIDLGVIEQVVGPMFGHGTGVAARYAPGWRSKKRGQFLSYHELETKLLNRRMETSRA